MKRVPLPDNIIVNRNEDEPYRDQIESQVMKHLDKRFGQNEEKELVRIPKSALEQFKKLMDKAKIPYYL